MTIGIMTMGPLNSRKLALNVAFGPKVSGIFEEKWVTRGGLRQPHKAPSPCDLWLAETVDVRAGGGAAGAQAVKPFRLHTLACTETLSRRCRPPSLPAARANMANSRVLRRVVPLMYYFGFSL